MKKSSNQPFVFFALLIAFLFIQCESKKEDKITLYYDTIFPKAYLPVYPGSWWKYCINDNTYAIDSVSLKYKLHSYQFLPEEKMDENGNFIQDFTDSAYVPFLNSEPIYGYDKIEWVRPPFGNYYCKWPILSETIGSEFDREWVDGRWGDCAEHLKVEEKIVRNNDSIIVLKGRWGLCDLGGKEEDTMRISIQEYTKNIGLTKYFIIDTIKQDTLYKKILIDFYINN
jgi:hypothetical protein